MLRDLNLKAVYRSDEDNILEDFYIPALSTAVHYQRAVGFFSAAMLSYAAQGLSAFVENKGAMQLVIGGELEAEDAQAIREGYDIRAIVDRLGTSVVQRIDSIADALCYRRLEALSWLIATGRLSIKMALRRRGMYHEKIGILRDANGDVIVFQGSANETANALLPDFNFESINVFQCWRPELQAHFAPYLSGFERLWANTARDTLVVDFPEAAARRLVRIAERGRLPTPELEIQLYREERADTKDLADGTSTPIVPRLLGDESFGLRDHQKLALNAWKAHDLHGILEHATGSGKTITALYGATKLFQATQRLALVVAVPYQNLADQWCSVMAQFRMSPLRCYGGKANWQRRLSDQSALFAAGALPFLGVVVVNRTLQSDDFQRALSGVPGECLMLVGDECHHHATDALSTSLPAHARMRLGLSATPAHYSDPNATNRLKRYYGDIVSTFSLADALAAQVITPYDYHVCVVELTAEETERYAELSEQIARLSAQRATEEATSPQDEQLKALLMKRARLLGSASQKLVALRRLVGADRPRPLTLFYCGDGSTEDNDDFGEATRSIEEVTVLLDELGWKCARFTARESRDERERLLGAFRVSAIDALVAIRCLDEGIDIPACRTAYLMASARNPRQFIQRRGRILRKSPGKDHATIWDFVVKLPSNSMESSPLERQLLVAELTRVGEFASLARNSVEAVRDLLPLLKEYDLAHLLV